MKNIAIELAGVTKKYKKLKAVDDISIKINTGEIHGFLGPNGAGKTTTINLILNLIEPSSGQVNVLGQKIKFGDSNYLSKIGFLSADEALPLESSANELLKLTSRLVEIDQKFVDKIVDLFEMKNLMSAKLKTLSRGNQRKVSILLALCTNAELLILDEPTEGLDPLMQERFYQLLNDKKAAGGTVFFSSHNLAEVQKICSSASFIKEGQIITTARIDELSDISIKKIELKLAKTPTQQQLDIMKKISINDHVIKLNDRTYSFEFRGDYADLLKSLLSFEISNINIHDIDLEAVFMRMYQKESQDE